MLAIFPEAINNYLLKNIPSNANIKIGNFYHVIV